MEPPLVGAIAAWEASVFSLHPRSTYFQTLVDQESLVIYERQIILRWGFTGVVAFAIALAHLTGHPAPAVESASLILPVFAAYNAWLHWRTRRGRLGKAAAYLNVSVDHALLCAYLVQISWRMSPENMVYSSANAIFPFIALYSAFRMDFWVLAYSIVVGMLCYNGLFWLGYPRLDPALAAALPELGWDGQIFRSLYLLTLELMFFFIPAYLRHLLAMEEKLFQEKEEMQQRYQADLEREVEAKTAELRQTNQALQTALDEVRTLEGLLPICSRCKKIRDGRGRWLGMEQYLANLSNVRVTHGLCEHCFSIIYPDIAEDVILHLKDLDKDG